MLLIDQSEERILLIDKKCFKASKNAL